MLSSEKFYGLLLRHVIRESLSNGATTFRNAVTLALCTSTLVDSDAEISVVSPKSSRDTRGQCCPVKFSGSLVECLAQFEKHFSFRYSPLKSCRQVREFAALNEHGVNP